MSQQQRRLNLAIRRAMRIVSKQADEAKANLSCCDHCDTLLFTHGAFAADSQTRTSA
jgi:hypothetical protein